MSTIILHRIKHFLLLGLVLLSACSQAQQTKPKQNKPTRDELIEANRKRLAQERKDIDKYIAANHYKMQQTGSGLYYMLVDEPTDTNTAITNGDRVVYAFIITTLSGDTVATSAKLGNRALTIGKENAEIGLHEALQLGYIGCAMRVILPSHLAHGISQNEFDVPPHTTLIYELTPIRIINN